MIWRRLSVLYAGFFGDRRAASAFSARWRRAADADPELKADILRLGGIFAHRPMEEHLAPHGDMAVRATPLSESELSYERGRRDLALTLLAAMNVTTSELTDMMEED